MGKLNSKSSRADKKNRDRRRRTEEQKAASRARSVAESSRRRRSEAWVCAAVAAAAAGFPFNVHITITWQALISAGERREGHVLGLPETARDTRVWARLRQVAAKAGVPWVAIRAPEHDARRGQHLHLALHLPDAGAVRDAIATIEAVTGAPAEFIDLRGRSCRAAARHHRGVVARSSCNGWMIQRTIEALGGDGTALIRYLSKADGAGKVRGQHRLSNALCGMVRRVA